VAESAAITARTIYQLVMIAAALAVQL